MRSRLRTFIMAALAVCLAAILCGCKGVVEIEFPQGSGYMDDKFIDILIPIDVESEDYTFYNETGVALRNGIDPVEIPADSAICGYHEDGYRSLIMHLDGAMTSDAHNEYIAHIFKIRLPAKYDSFEQFCRDYNTCRLAVVDFNGDIMYVTDDVKLKSHEFVAMKDKIDFFVEDKKVTVGYDMPALEKAVMFVFSLLTGVGLIYMAALVLIYLCAKKTTSNLKVCTIIAVILTLPSLLLLFLKLRMAVCTSANIVDALSMFLGYNSVFELLGMLVPTGVLTFFCLMLKPFGEAPPVPTEIIDITPPDDDN